MSASERFNLKFLRKRTQITRDWLSSRTPQLSRRTFLALSSAGVAATAVPFLFRGDGFSIVQTDGCVEVLVGSVTRWTIDPSQFGSHARVKVKRDADRILLELAHAVFPGTIMNADFRCILTRSAGAWVIQFTSPLGFELIAPWIDWLERKRAATGKWNARHLRPIEALSVSFKVRSTVRFTPDWIFSADACSVELEGLPRALHCSRLKWSLNPTDRFGPTIAGDAATLFQFERGGQEWHVPVQQEHSDGWRLDHSHDADLFDELAVETAQAERTLSHSALLSSTFRHDSSLRFFPGGGLSTATNEPFHLRLEQPRLAFSLSEAPVRSALVADFAAEETWAHTEDLSIAFGGNLTDSAFELHSVDRATTVVAAPPMTAVQVPAPDVSIQLKFANGKAPLFQWSHFVQRIERALAVFHLLPGEHHLAFDLTCGDVLTVVRPADMLSLKFEFQDMQLHSGAFAKLRAERDVDQAAVAPMPLVGDNDQLDAPKPGTQFPVPQLRCKPLGTPVVTVTFPPQHIEEQAFFHNDDNPAFKVQASGLAPLEIQQIQKQDGSLSTLALVQALVDPDSPTATKINPDSVPVVAHLAGESNLVFDVANIKSIPFTLESLLNWKSWTLKVDKVARTDATPIDVKNKPDGSPLPNPAPPLPKTIPDKNVATSIELPYRLLLSPSERAQWAHSPKPVIGETGNIELWHTRLSVASPLGLPDESNQIDRTVRAIYSPDRPQDLATPLPFHQSNDPRFALDARDRAELVHLTSDYNISAYKPLPVSVDHLILTSLGGYLKSNGTWQPPKMDKDHILTVEQWKHIATVGRDQYVRVVYKGYLAPFSHRASLVKVTERFIVQVAGAPNPKYWYAMLHQRMYIVVHEPRRDFPLLGQPFGGRDFPFQRVDVLTTVTPDLDDPAKQVVTWHPPLVTPTQSQSLFWPCVNGQQFNFRFRFWDLEGNVSEASMPVVFGDALTSQTAAGVQQMCRLYNGGSGGQGEQKRQDKLLAIPFADQTIAFAPTSQPGDTRYDAATMLWQVRDQSGNDDANNTLYLHDLPLFAPQLHSASVSSSSVKRISNTGNAASSAATNADGIWVQFFDLYKRAGFDCKVNRGEVLLEIVDKKGMKLQFGASSKTDQSGGFTSPDTNIVGFSRKSGPVGGTQSTTSLSTWSTGKFDPPDFFGGLTTAKILGAVKLSDIIAPLLGGLDSNLEKVPQMIQQSLYNIEKTLLDFEKAAVEAIQKFQNFLPTGANRQNPLARRVAAQAQVVFANYDSVTKIQGDSPDLMTDVAAAAYHAKLVRSIMDYGQAVEAAVNNPAALAAGLTDDLLAALAPALEAAEDQILVDISAMAAQLVDGFASTLDSAVKTFFLPLNKLVSAVLDDPLPLPDDKLRSGNMSIHDATPELMAVAAMLPVAQRLQADLEKLKGKVKQGTTSIQVSITDLPSVLDLTTAVYQDLLQLQQSAGPLGCVGLLSPTDWTKLLTAMREIETRVQQVWDTAQGAKALAEQLAAVEVKCMAFAQTLGAADQSQAMQNLRQLERTMQVLDACRAAFASVTDNSKKPAATVRYGQRLQQLQRQAIDSIRVLQRLATSVLDPNSGAAAAEISAAQDLLAALYVDSGILLTQVTCINSLVAQVARNLLNDSQGNFALSVFLPVISVQLNALDASLSQRQNDATNAIRQANKAGQTVSAARNAYAAALTKNPTDPSEIQKDKAALDQAWTNAIPTFAPVTDAIADVYDGMIRYQSCIALVLTWWTYCSQEALKVLSSREKLAPLAKGFADSACQAGGATSVCSTAAKGLNSVEAQAKAVAAAINNAGRPVAALFAGATDPIGKLQGLPVNPTPAQVIDQTRQALVAFSQCAAAVRSRLTDVVRDLESLAQAKNILPLLLANIPGPHTLALTYDWHPQVKSFEPVFLLDPGADFRISANSQIDLTGQKAPSFNISGTLTNFSINLIGSPSFVIIRVKSLQFTSQNGNKPDCRLAIAKVDFGQDLAFVQEMANMLNPQSGPFMELVGNGIRTGFRFSIPDIQMGGFLLMQLAIEVAVALSFDGEPVRCQFSLSDQQNPFLLSAGIYGGGGYLQLQLGLDGVQALEGALEFGLVAGISIGPLTGSGYVVAGVYIRVAKSSSSVAGFVHAHGHMDIFGIISMDVDLLVMVKYTDGQVSGSAIFTVSVHILFFSASYTLEASYGFQGSKNQSSLDQNTSDTQLAAMAPSEPLDPWLSDEEWTKYCEAFAA